MAEDKPDKPDKPKVDPPPVVPKPKITVDLKPNDIFTESVKKPKNKD